MTFQLLGFVPHPRIHKPRPAPIGVRGPPRSAGGRFPKKYILFAVFGLRSGLDGSEQAVGFIWSLFRAKPSILDPFRTKFDVFGPDRNFGQPGFGLWTSPIAAGKPDSLSETSTSVLSQQQTSVLSQQQTSVLSQQQTSVLSQQKTSILSQPVLARTGKPLNVR